MCVRVHVYAYVCVCGCVRMCVCVCACVCLCLNGIHAGSFIFTLFTSQLYLDVFAWCLWRMARGYDQCSDA